MHSTYPTDDRPQMMPSYGGMPVITYVDISLFESPAQTLVNTVNTVGVMGKGIAKVFKQIYPDMFTKYRALCQERQFQVGQLYIYRTTNKIVVNFPTKQHWRNPSQVAYIEEGLKKFVATYQDYGITSVSFPQLGCGHGELDWTNQVQPLMERYLSTLPIPVYIHLYTKAANFVPERLDSAFAREMRQERQRISADQVWHDLQHTINHLSEESPLTVTMDDEHLYFAHDDQHAVVYREDIEDIWNVLRLRGTMRTMDVPQHILDQPFNAESVGTILFTVLSRLAYVKPITLGTKQHDTIVREPGLQYVPSARVDLLRDGEIVI